MKNERSPYGCKVISVITLLSIGSMVALTVGYSVLDTIEQAIVLRPAADRLGTPSNRAAIAEYVNGILQKNLGSQRYYVHRQLQEVGDFEFPENSVHTRYDGMITENVHWTVARGFIGNERLVWTLQYDAGGRLFHYEIADMY